MSLRIEQNRKWSNKTFPHNLSVVSTSDETTPLFNSTGFCKVGDHCRQKNRCDCVCTDRNLSILEQNYRVQLRAVRKGLPGLFPSRKREIGSFSIDDGNGSENVSFKMNSRFFNLYRVYSNLMKMASVGEFSWS